MNMLSKMTHKQRIEKAHISLMRNKNWIWLAPTCLIGNVIITEEVSTAATDGRDVYYNPKFLDKMSDAQIRATVVHENLHKAFRHLAVYAYLREKEDPEAVNAAMDFVINRYIVRERNSDPSKKYLDTWDGLLNYLYDPKYEDDAVWDTLRVLEDLKQQGSGGQGGKGKQGGAVGADEWSNGSTVDGHEWAKARARDKAEEDALVKEIESALRQGQHLSKKMSGNTPREIGELLDPAIDWKDALRDFVVSRVKGSEYGTFSRPNRRHLARHIYMPSKYTEQVERLGFFVDTSGSIGPEDLREVLSEVQGCIESVHPKYVDIIYWDTAVARHENYEDQDVHNIMKSTKPAGGGGGTSPSCVIPFVRERRMEFDVVIWLSDGYVGGDWAEELGAPAFWVISSGGAVPSHFPHVQLPRR